MCQEAEACTFTHCESLFYAAVSLELYCGFYFSSGAKLDDFADYTTFGIATSLLLRTPHLIDNILCMCYGLSVFIRVCFYTSGTAVVAKIQSKLV
jgi:phosphatidylserine synthase